MEAFLKGGKLGKPSSSSAVDGGPSGSGVGGGKKKGTGSRRRGPVPWVEKYRPRTVDDVASQDEVVAVLKRTLQGADLPNLLFYGPPGTGKTSTILAAARDLFSDLYSDRVLELNASDERGIQVIREKVKNFAQLTAGGKRSDGRPCPPFKLIVLDEADSMTHAAQAALRRTMEKESKSTRFCLICNYVSRIIAPIASRCAKFRFRPLAKDVVLARIGYIGEEEKLQCSPGTGERLHSVADGDLRQCITLFQSLAKLKADDVIEPDDVDEVSGLIPASVISEFLEQCRRHSFERMEACVEKLLLRGYSGYQFVLQLHDAVIGVNEETEHDLTDGQKALLAEKMAVVDHRLMAGADEYLQLVDLGCVVLQALSMTDDEA